MMEEKEFDRWNEEKKCVHNVGKRKYFREREIWWCKMGINVGDEQDGTGQIFDRPVLIIKGLSMNTCLIASLTSSKNLHKMRIPIGNIDGKDDSVILSQLKTIDTKRLIEKICNADSEKFEDVRKAIRELF